MQNNTTFAGAPWTRVLLATSLLLVLASSCGTDTGERSSEPAPGEVDAGMTDAAAEPAADDDAKSQMTRSLRAAHVLARQRAAGPEYAVLAERTELTAYNPAQAMSLWFGVRVEMAPDRGDWTLSLHVDAFGCEDDMAPLEADEPEMDDTQPNQVWQDHGPLSAWYLNGPLGLQQGFEVEERPACADDAPLRVRVGVEGLRPAMGSRGEVVLRDAEGRQAMQVDGLYVTDAEGAELAAALVVDGDAVVVDVHAAGAVFPLSIDPLFAADGSVTASDGAPNDEFGQSVGISGDQLIVASDVSAYVYRRDPFGFWGDERKLVPAQAGDLVGRSAAISGDRAIVMGLSAVHFFVRDPILDTWSEEQRIAGTGLEFGVSVDIDGDRAIVGDRGLNGSEGGAFIYERNGSTGLWELVATLTPVLDASGSSSDACGASVSISGDLAAMGCPLGLGFLPDEGSAYVYRRDAGAWPLDAQLISGMPFVGSFGNAVSLKGNQLAVGLPTTDFGGGPAGAAMVFARDEMTGSWNGGVFVGPSMNPPPFVPTSGCGWLCQETLSSWGRPAPTTPSSSSEAPPQRPGARSGPSLLLLVVPPSRVAASRLA